MRILVISRPDRIGDVVISTSCLAPIREKYPDTRIYFLAAERMRPFLEGHPLLAGFLPLSINLAAEFRRLEPDAIVHLHPDKQCYTAACVAAVPMRIGYRVRILGRQLTHAFEDHRREGLQHEGEYNLDLLQPLGVTRPEKLLGQVHLPEASRVSLQSKLPWPMAATSFAVLNPSAHSRIARWPRERFMKVAEELHRVHGLTPVFIGMDSNDSIPRGTAGCLDLAGRTDLGELGWLLRHARLLVTNDSGPGHLAAALGCPVVAIFGRTAPMYGPVRWRPLSEKAVVVARPLPRQRFEGRDKFWRRSFAGITEAEVLAAAQAILQANDDVDRIRKTTQKQSV